MNYPTNYTITEGVEQFYRRQSARVTAHLIRYFGIEHVNAITTCVYQTIMSAKCTWPHKGMPANPSAWIQKRARKQMLLSLRALDKDTSPKQQLVNKQLADNLQNEVFSLPLTEFELNDDLLQLIFICCHPKLSKEQQLVLSLQLLCGFSIQENADILRKSIDSITRIYQCGIQKMENRRQARLPYDMPVERKLDKVLNVFYQLFNEAYNMTCGHEISAKDVCLEVINLAHVITTNSCGNKPIVHALISLMYFQSSRLDARCNGFASLMTLNKQDRSLWDKWMISKGWEHFRISAEANLLTVFHLEAGIAAQHAVAKSFEDTDWEIILNYYNMLIQIKDTPIIALHRIVVYAHVYSEKEALKEFDRIENDTLQQFYLYHAIRSDLQEKTGKISEARRSLRKAIKLSKNEKEIQFMQEKLKTIKA